MVCGRVQTELTRTEPQTEDLLDYSHRLERYTLEELEDIYFNIHVLQNPVRYQMVMRELERRRLHPPGESGTPAGPGDVRYWLERWPLFARHRRLAGAVTAVFLSGFTTVVTFALLLPIWLFAVPLRFRGIETAIVYLAFAPVPPILAAGMASRLGGRGIYVI